MVRSSSSDDTESTMVRRSPEKEGYNSPLFDAATLERMTRPSTVRRGSATPRAKGAVSRRGDAPSDAARVALLGLGLALCFGCGPDVAVENGSGAAGGTEGTDGPASATADSHDSLGSSGIVETTTGASTAAASDTTGAPFACAIGEQLVPGYCFERIDFAIPGPLVMQRAVGGDIDGDGADELVIELLFGDTKTLTVWEHEPGLGPMLVQEVLGWPHDFEQTTLLSGDRDGNGLDDILRTIEGGVDYCTPDPESYLLECDQAPSVVDHLYPAVVAHLFGMQSDQLISQAQIEELGHRVYLIGGGSLGAIEDSKSTPPCEDLIAVAVGDVDGNGEPDILHRSSVDCVDKDDPRRDDVHLRLGDGTDIPPAGPSADADIEPTLLLVADFDGDGTDSVLAGNPSSPDGYRVLRYAERGWAEPLMAMGPADVDRLEQARLRDAETPDVLYGGAVLHITPSPFEPSAALPSELGRLLAVADLDGDGQDDLLLEGPDTTDALTVLLSR